MMNCLKSLSLPGRVISCNPMSFNRLQFYYKFIFHLKKFLGYKFLHNFLKAYSYAEDSLEMLEFYFYGKLIFDAFQKCL